MVGVEDGDADDYASRGAVNLLSVLTNVRHLEQSQENEKTGSFKLA